MIESFFYELHSEIVNPKCNTAREAFFGAIYRVSKAAELEKFWEKLPTPRTCILPRQEECTGSDACMKAKNHFTLEEYDEYTVKCR